MRIKEELDSCSNRKAYNRLYKHYISNKYGLCDRGSWHHMCNRSYRNLKSWKRYRKNHYRVRNY